MNAYPRSFFEYALTALFVFALPFLAAAAGMSWFVERVALDSSTAIRAALAVGESRRALDAQLTQLERTAKQLQVLGDNLLRERYASLHTRFESTLDAYRAAAQSDAERSRLAELGVIGERIAQVVATEAPDSPELARAAVDFDRLAQLAQQAGAASDAALTERLDTLQARADRAIGTFLTGAGALLGAAVLLAFGLARALARPVRALAASVRSLGQGDWSRPVRVRGPRDLADLGDALDRLRLRLADLQRQRIRFVQHVSHDLKTPLASLREGSALLADGTMGELSSSQHEVVTILVRMTKRLETMIERLLAFAAAPPARAIERRELRLDELLARSVEEQKLQWSGRQLDVRVEARPVQAMVDEEGWRAIVDNLLVNAIRFSPPGGLIRLALDETPTLVRLRVLDEGPGIPPDERELVFEPFWTKSRPTQAASGESDPQAASDGTGLGLAIAREQARLHGGELRLADSPRGACFELVLPRIN